VYVIIYTYHIYHSLLHFIVLVCVRLCILAFAYKHASFGEDRSRGLVWQWVEFWHFPLTCVVAVTTLHYRASV